jgi:hypothetical protein
MKRWVLAVGALALWSQAAMAAPGDPRVVQGTLQWPPTLAGGPFIVVGTEDGRSVYVNLKDARRVAPGDIIAGNRISAVGVEGPQPHEVSAVTFGPGDSALPPSGGPPASAGGTGAPAGAVIGAPAESRTPSWRLHGTVRSIVGTALVLRTPDGISHTIDVTNLSMTTRQSLRAGDDITLFGESKPEGKLVASGFVQSETMPPAASPR